MLTITTKVFHQAGPLLGRPKRLKNVEICVHPSENETTLEIRKCIPSQKNTSGPVRIRKDKLRVLAFSPQYFSWLFPSFSLTIEVAVVKLSGVQCLPACQICFSFWKKAALTPIYEVSTNGARTHLVAGMSKVTVAWQSPKPAQSLITTQSGGSLWSSAQKASIKNRLIMGNFRGTRIFTYLGALSNP